MSKIKLRFNISFDIEVQEHHYEQEDSPVLVERTNFNIDPVDYIAKAIDDGSELRVNVHEVR